MKKQKYCVYVYKRIRYPDGSDERILIEYYTITREQLPKKFKYSKTKKHGKREESDEEDADILIVLQPGTCNVFYELRGFS